MKIKNKPNVILKDSVPEVSIIYSHPTHGNKIYNSETERENIIKQLSTGERKAFYLLNVMFEIEVAQKNNTDNIFILDDIVDSFDYKNKYAFLEYLYDISNKYNHIKLIILTHNFDFFRLLQLRLFGNGYRKKSWFAQKNNGKINLTTAGEFNIIQNTIQSAVSDCTMWFSLIPFARNIIEYRIEDTNNDSDYQTLTECLHELDVKHSVDDIQNILVKEFHITGNKFSTGDDFEVEFFKAADNIFADASNSAITIQNNLVLAIASRRLAEKYMKSKMTDQDIKLVKRNKKDFTHRLYNKFVEKANPSESEKNELEKINLITPEQIHVNSFMYEPLIDMGMDELKSLYSSMKKLNNIPDSQNQ